MCAASHARCAFGLRGSVSVVAAVPIASRFQMAAIWRLSNSRARRITASPAAARARRGGAGRARSVRRRGGRGATRGASPTRRGRDATRPRGRGPALRSPAARGRSRSSPSSRPPFASMMRRRTSISEINCFDSDHQLVLTPMDLALGPLRTLEAIARHGSFSRAARELNLSQPAVSMQVAQLERRLGLPLLERVGKRAFPTRAGEVLLAHAARAFRELQAGVEHVQELRGVVAGRVRLGTSASISVYLLPLALGRFRARFPAIDLVVVTGTASEVARGLVANDLDVGLASLPLRDRELAVTPFYRDELVAIAPPDPRWRRRGTIRAVELAEHPLILFDRASTVRREIDAWFARARVTARAAMELGNTEAMKKFVEAGLGLSVTSEFSVKADVAARRLAAMRLEPSLTRQIGLVRRRDKPVAPPLAAFLGALEDLRATLAPRR